MFNKKAQDSHIKPQKTKSRSNSNNKNKSVEKDSSNILKNRVLNLKAYKITKEEEPNDEKLNKVFKKHLPKNVNEYRHIIDSMPSRDSDVEWVLELRAYDHKRNYESLKKSVGSHPDIYRKSFDEYRNKVLKDIKIKKDDNLLLKGNSRDFEHLFNKRTGMAANPAQLGFDSTLRSFDNKRPTFQNEQWKTISISQEKNLLSTYLPPMVKISKYNLEKLKTYISRPYEQIIEVINILIN